MLTSKFRIDSLPLPKGKSEFRVHVDSISRHSSAFLVSTLSTVAIGYLFKVYVARLLGAEAAAFNDGFVFCDRPLISGSLSSSSGIPGLVKGRTPTRDGSPCLRHSSSRFITSMYTSSGSAKVRSKALRCFPNRTPSCCSRSSIAFLPNPTAICRRNR